MGFDQTDGGAAFPGASGAANAVHIDVGRSWQVDVDDVADIG